jgi:hypothetical protein
MTGLWCIIFGKDNGDKRRMIVEEPLQWMEFVCKSLDTGILQPIDSLRQDMWPRDASELPAFLECVQFVIDKMRADDDIGSQTAVSSDQDPTYTKRAYIEYPGMDNDNDDVPYILYPTLVVDQDYCEFIHFREHHVVCEMCRTPIPL